MDCMRCRGVLVWFYMHGHGFLRHCTLGFTLASAYGYYVLGMSQSHCWGTAAHDHEKAFHFFRLSLCAGLYETGLVLRDADE